MARTLLLVGSLLFVLWRGCGFTPVDGKGVGEPCTRTSECMTGLECGGGVCRHPPDGGSDAGSADGG